MKYWETICDLIKIQYSFQWCKILTLIEFYNNPYTLAAKRVRFIFLFFVTDFPYNYFNSNLFTHRKDIRLLINKVNMHCYREYNIVVFVYHSKFHVKDEAWIDCIKVQPWRSSKSNRTKHLKGQEGGFIRLPFPFRAPLTLC